MLYIYTYPFRVPYMVPPFLTVKIWSRVFQSRVFHPGTFHGPPFSIPAFTASPTYLTKHKRFRSSVGRWCHKNRNFEVKILQKVINRPLSLFKILRTVTILIVIISTHCAQNFAYATITRSPVSYAIFSISCPVSSLPE